MARTKQVTRKRNASAYESDNGSVEETNDGPPVKRTKSQASGLQPQTDSDGNTFWEISKMRRVTISQFKGMQMVGVREYYEQGGELKPGKKGISMPVEQYAAFVELLPQIETELAKKGEKVPRPEYDGQAKKEGGRDDEEVKSEVDKGNGLPRKSNIEATSDEDEDEE